MADITEANVGLIFGTDTGNTEEIGEKITTALAAHGVIVEMINVTDTSPEEIEGFDFIIMGIPTWDFGGIQEDWEEFEEQILATKLAGKTVALYGLGDQRGYGFYFLDAVGWLNERVLKAGAQVIGHWPTKGYDFDESLALTQDRTHFVGLGIDEDQQFELTDERVETWVNQIVAEYASANAA
ncbi:flavodoxin [Gilvimarinus sp. DA14]|uniref:flavodoxin n=1 Tax=Gilvimarinus sp. DA14 TaxID=2956798 RepID=UPI0020B8C66C|nr:flavodoxin [Gilvimarinus sp. DA14]UTF60606.1 flavodoxin [Gilvimarinus sp. DA14]